MCNRRISAFPEYDGCHTKRKRFLKEFKHKRLQGFTANACTVAKYKSAKPSSFADKVKPQICKEIDSAQIFFYFQEVYTIPFNVGSAIGERFP